MRKSKISESLETNYFIAEVSSNHEQDLERSLEFIRKSAEVGCSAVKFQLFKVNSLFSKEARYAFPHIEQRRQWELPIEFIPELKEACDKNQIEFGCTPFYIEAVAELYPYVDFYKIASYELLWLDLIEACLETGKPVIVSTGMATLNEVQAVVELSRKYPNTPFKLMHCSSAYPVKYSEVNLQAIRTMHDEFNCDVGWSDHSQDPIVILSAALTWNARLFEVHLDLDGNGAEYGQGHCWLPNDLKKTIDLVQKSIYTAGDGVKAPGLSEAADREWRADPSDGLRPIKAMRGDL